MMVGLATVTPILGSSNAAAEETFETVAPDPTVVAVVDGPGGIGYWVVAADGSVEVIGTSIVPPLGEREPITDRVRTAYAGVRGALGIWLELADGTKLAVGDPGPSIFTGHDRPPGWLSGLAVKQLMAGSWVDEIDRGCVTELPRAVRIGQLLLPTMTESQFGAAVEESRDHQIAGILLSGGATPWIGRRISELQDFAGRLPLHPGTRMAVGDMGHALRSRWKHDGHAAISTQSHRCDHVLYESIVAVPVRGQAVLCPPPGVVLPDLASPVLQRKRRIGYYAVEGG